MADGAVPPVARPRPCNIAGQGSSDFFFARGDQKQIGPNR